MLLSVDDDTVYRRSSKDTSSPSSSRVFEFDMKALRELLRAQSEKNPGASYFNIDILKYQVSVSFSFVRLFFV